MFLFLCAEEIMFYFLVVCVFADECFIHWCHFLLRIFICLGGLFLTDFPWSQDATHDHFIGEVMPKLRFMHGSFKKCLVPLVLLLLGYFRHQALNSALQSKFCLRGGPPGLRQSINTSHLNVNLSQGMDGLCVSVYFKLLLKYILGWLQIQYFNLRGEYFYQLLILIMFHILFLGMHWANAHKVYFCLFQLICFGIYIWLCTIFCSNNDSILFTYTSLNYFFHTTIYIRRRTINWFTSVYFLNIKVVHLIHPFFMIYWRVSNGFLRFVE